MANSDGRGHRELEPDELVREFGMVRAAEILVERQEVVLERARDALARAKRAHDAAVRDQNRVVISKSVLGAAAPDVLRVLKQAADLLTVDEISKRLSPAILARTEALSSPNYLSMVLRQLEMKRLIVRKYMIASPEVRAQWLKTCSEHGSR